VRSLIKNCIDDPAVLHYANSSAILEEMNSQKTMAMNLFDCAIVNLKMSQGLKIAKQELYLSKNGFNRENLNNHNIMMKTKMTRRDKILLALSASSVASNQEKASQMINDKNVICTIEGWILMALFSLAVSHFYFKDGDIAYSYICWLITYICSIMTFRLLYAIMYVDTGKPLTKFLRKCQ
jgi:hypothetical protein